MTKTARITTPTPRYDHQQRQYVVCWGDCLGQRYAERYPTREEAYEAARQIIDIPTSVAQRIVGGAR